MLRKSIIILLIGVSLITGVFLTHAQSADAKPALNAVLADLSTRVGGRITIDQLSHYSYVERMAEAGKASCPAAASLYPIGNERAWSITVSYHGTVYWYFAAQNGGAVVRCGSYAATGTPTFTPSATRGPTLTPTTSPTPTATATASTCTGFMTSRLFVGDQAMALPGNTLNLRAQPQADAPLVRKVYENVPFAVLQGPVCDATNGRAWWQVRYNNDVGWLVEGEKTEYFVTSLVTRQAPTSLPTATSLPPTATLIVIQVTQAPTIPPRPTNTLVVPTAAPTLTLMPSPTPTTAIDACANLMKTRLTIGGQGRVAGDPSNMRDTPNSSGAVVRKMYRSIVFTVLNGPTCDDKGRAWWQVKYNDSIGWAAEGDGGEYWLEPVP